MLILLSSKWYNDLNLFLTMCSVLLPPSFLETLDHFLPSYLTASTRLKSSRAVQFLLTGTGSRWLIQYSRHCLAVLKYFLPERMNNSLAISFHLFLMLLALNFLFFLLNNGIEKRNFSKTPFTEFRFPLKDGKSLELKHFWVPIIKNLTENFPVPLILNQLWFTIFEMQRFFRYE